MRISIYIITFSFFILLSCVKLPDEPLADMIDIGDHGALILCEGLYGQNNSSLSIYYNASKEAYNNVLKEVNENFLLGDTANDIYVKGDSVFIVVSTNKKITVIDKRTGKLIKEIFFEGKRYPRKMAAVNDSVLAVSDLYDHSFSLINSRSLKIIADHIFTGPAPEGIAVSGNYIFVANSGFGDYLADEPKAGTISIFDINTMYEIDLIENLPNVIGIKVDLETNRLYASFNHLPKYKDSVGGIVEFDLANFRELRRWSDIIIDFKVSKYDNSIYYLYDKGVKKINLSDNFAMPETIITNKSDDLWHSLSISSDLELWVGNAKDYQSLGEVLVYDIITLSQINKFKVGLNPNTIVFF